MQVECRVILLLQRFLLLERNESDRIPLGNELVQSLLVCISALWLISLNLLDNSLLCGKVLLKFLSLVSKVLCLSCKELVTGGAESLPYGIGLLARDRTDCLPDILEVNQLVCSLLPVLTVFNLLGLLAEIFLFLEILLHHILELGVELSL